MTLRGPSEMTAEGRYFASIYKCTCLHEHDTLTFMTLHV